jgi:hypothetical protein
VLAGGVDPCSDRALRADDRSERARLDEHEGVVERE